MSYRYFHLLCPGKLFYGPVPDIKDMVRLNCVEQVDTVWNLLAECPTVFQKEKTIFSEVLHSPIVDYQIPIQGSNFISNLQEVCFRLESGKNVFVHCLGGHGRTGMAIAALLIKINKMSIRDALRQAQEICHGPEREIQKDFIRKAFSLGEEHA